MPPLSSFLDRVENLYPVLGADEAIGVVRAEVIKLRQSLRARGADGEIATVISLAAGRRRRAFARGDLAMVAAMDLVISMLNFRPVASYPEDVTEH